MNIIEKLPQRLLTKLGSINTTLPVKCWTLTKSNNEVYRVIKYRLPELSQNEKDWNVKSPIIRWRLIKNDEKLYTLYPKISFIVFCGIVYIIVTTIFHKYLKYITKLMDDYENKISEQRKNSYYKGKQDGYDWITQGHISADDMRKYSEILGFIEKKKNENYENKKLKDKMDNMTKEISNLVKLFEK